MANAIVPITAGTGTDIQAFENLVAGVSVKTQAMALVDQSGAPIGTASNALLTTDPDVTSAGTITTTDSSGVTAPAGDGTFRTGTSSATSYVTVKAPGGDSAWVAAITGTWTGTLYYEGSPDSTNGIDGNWININGRMIGIVNTVLGGNAVANGMYRGNTSGLTYFRVRAVGAFTGSAAVRLNISGGTGATFLNASIPAGSNAIGSVSPTQPAVVTGTITSATSVVTVPCVGMGIASVAMTGPTFANVTVVFEGTLDGTTWFRLTGMQPENREIRDGFYGQNGGSLNLIDIPLGSYLQFRVRATTYTSGTANIAVSLRSIAYNPYTVALCAGAIPAGAGVFTNPVMVGGSDGTNARYLSMVAKGAQGAFAVSSQDLKDAGRTRVSIVFQAVAPATADTLLSLVKVANGVAAAGVTSIGVTAGKVLRITAVSFSIKANAAAAAFATMTLRGNPTGATVIGSPSEMRLDLGNTAAVVGASDKVEAIIPDGMEWSGAQTLGISLAAQAVTNIMSISLHGFEY